MIKTYYAPSFLVIASLLLCACGDKTEAPEASSVPVEPASSSLTDMNVDAMTDAAEAEVKAVVAEAEAQIEEIKAEAQEMVEQEVAEVIEAAEAQVEAVVEETEAKVEAAMEEAQDAVESQLQEAAADALADQLKSGDVEDTATAIKGLF